jgi:aspartyl-tRNA(Asn)/glutamyl-tRNA(Gln) amidotransferase subunit B
LKVLNEQKIEITEFPVESTQFAELLSLIMDRTISQKIAKTVFQEMLDSGENPKKIVDKKGLVQISDSTKIGKIVQKVIEENSKQVEEYKAGKEKVFGYLVGQVMHEFKGKADPAVVNKILRMKLT